VQRSEKPQQQVDELVTPQPLRMKEEAEMKIDVIPSPDAT